MYERTSISDKIPGTKSQNLVPHIRRKTEYSQSMNSPVDRILFLQRTIGNQAVQKLVRSGTLQAKLKIGQPGDVYEQEADRVSEQVMRMPDVSEAKDTRIQRKCPKCLKGLTGLIGKDKKEEKLQAKEISRKTPEITSQTEENINALKGGGQPLPESTRAFFEPRFGRDFSNVQLHTDAKAAESARTVNARAYTVGNNVVFGEGQYAPGTGEGGKLLAHELTHVVQQNNKTINSDTKFQFVSQEGMHQQNAIHEKISHTMDTDMMLQRVKNGRKRFKCPFYADDRGKLERCLNDEDRLRPGEKGDSVFRVQTGLKADGEYMGKINSIYDAATGQAVMAFKRNHCLGFEQYPDVGPGTMRCLDELCLSNGTCGTCDKKRPPDNIPPDNIPPKKQPPDEEPYGPFLDLQIYCLAKKMELCNLPGGIPDDNDMRIYGDMCKNDTNYEGPPVRLKDLQCDMPGMAIAQSLEKSYPGWRKVLPDCPCTVNIAESDTSTWNTSNLFIGTYHPGAHQCFRSVRGYQTVAGTSHGQQCCFNKSGTIIYEGQGAGTPDVWTTFMRHQEIDVYPWTVLGWEIYNRYWVPNKGSKC